MNDKVHERHAMGQSKQPELIVIEDHGGAFEVWLNTGIQDYDGLCIGSGDTRDEAIAQAVRVFEWAGDELQQPGPTATEEPR